ncbi:T9SS-dependent choice-of-anchor J family protein [Ignavibacterium album]|nr:choice-of-anchor J domain-containing protein [Ignavibacterium album]
MIKLIKFFTILIVLFFSMHLYAQVSSMQFSSSSGTYTEITGGTLLGSATSDDQYFVDPAIPLGGTTKTGPGFPIGFDFVINGNTFDRFGINNNGWISFGKSALTPSVDMNTTSAYTPLSSTTAITPAELRTRVAGLGRDLQAQTGAELRFELIGTAPNRTLVIQWKGYRKFGATGDNYNFQIRINETSNTVEVVYGTMTNNTTSTTVQVGIGGSSASDFNNRTTTTDWTASTAGATNSATMTLSNTVFPPVGLTYQWQPPAPTDLGAIALVSPPNLECFGSTETVTVQIKNYGSATINFAVTPATVYASVTGPNPQTFSPVIINSGTLAPGATQDVTITTTYNMTGFGTYTFNAYTAISGDGNSANDAMSPVIRANVAPATLPEFVDFTGFTGANLTTVFPNWKEASGVSPSGTSSAWTSQTGLGGTGNITARINLYTTSRNEWIIGPKIIPQSNTVLKFSAAVTDWNSVTLPDSMGSDDKVRVMVSTDCGLSWTSIFQMDASTGLTNTLTQFTIPLASYSGQEIKIAFYATDGPTDDPQDYDFHIDDIYIGGPAPDNPASFAAVPLSSSQIQLTFTTNSNNNNVVIVWNNTGTFTSPSGAPPSVGQPFAGGTLLYNGLVSPVNHSGLTGNTQYYYKAFSYNGSVYSPGLTSSATTLCDPVSTLNENFDGVTTPNLPSCWYKVGTGGSVSTQGSSANSSPNCLYIYSTSTSSLAVVSLPPLSNAGAGTHRLRFYARANFTVGGVIHIGYLTNPNDANSFVKLDSIVANSLSYQQFTKFLGNAPGSNQVLAFRHSGSPANSVLIDDVVWEPVPVGVPNPAVVVSPADSATNVAINTSLNWLSGGGAPETGYRIYFGTDGGGVTPPTNILNNVDLGLVTTYTPASPLSYSTTYYWMIVPYNGSGNATGTPIWRFTTMPDPTITPPYTQNFEGTFPPINWTRFTGLLQDTSVLTSTTAGWVQDDWRNISSPVNKAARLNIWSTTTRYWLVTPPINLGTGSTNYQIEFDLTLNAYGTSNPPGTSGVDDKFAVVISTDGGTTWLSANTLRLWDNAGSPYVYNNINHLGEHVILNLTGYTGIVKIGFYGESTVSNADNDLMVDNFEVKEVPTTPLFTISPTSKDFGTVISGNTKSANFTITNTGVGTLSINSGGITLTGTNANQFSLGSISYPINLTSGQSAQITVNFSPTSAGVKTANLQIVHNAPGSPAVVPLTGNALPAGILFEDFTGAAFPPDGWIAVNNDAGTKNWIRNTGKFTSSPASASSSWESTILRNNDWLITPKLVVSSGDSIIFWISAASSSYTEELVVKVGSTNDPNGSWTTLDSILTNNPGWERKSYSLNAFAGQNVYIAFVNRGLDKFTVYIDDVVGPQVYIPAVDVALQSFYQASGLPVPRGVSQFEENNIYVKVLENSNKKEPVEALSNTGSGVKSTTSNNTVVVDNSNVPIELNNIQIKAAVKNLGQNATNYTINYSVGGINQTPFSGPTISSGQTDTATIIYNPSSIGTFIAAGTVTATGDEVPGNNNNQFRMRVYPDSYTRTIYDRADNVVDTWVGWADTTVRMKAGVRFTAPSEIKLAGVDFICRTEAVNSGTFEVQVRAAGDSAGAPGAVLYTQVYSANDYFAGAGDYIFFPFGNDAPTIASGSDYWITVKAPLGVLYPGAVHNTGFTSGRSFFEGSADTTVWNPLVITTERAWIMRAVHIPAAATFQLTVSVGNGWNMVSVPGLHPVDQNILTWWPGKDPAANVFKFQGAYQSVTTVQPGLGYWMKHLGANTYNTGDEWPAGGINIVAHDPLNAAAGWNLIGGYEFLAPTSALTTNPSGLISGFVYGYTTSGGYQVASDLVPGYGYWLKLTAAGQININPGPKANFKLSDFIPDDFGKIIITDNAGKSYTLYVAQGNQAQKTSLDFFELPPAPFSDMFDVRYTSGRFVEDLSSAMKTIQMQGVEYPVRVRVEGMMLRITDETGKAVNERVKSGEEITISNSQIRKLNVMSDIIPDKYSLEQNYPNPFNPTTTIEFSLPEDVENVRLTIYNALGEKVAELVNGKMEAGRYRYQWNAGNVATGLYIYELKTNKFSSVKKMMLLK